MSVSLPHRIAASLRRFAMAEDGHLLIFALSFMSVMFLFSGMAVDLMRYENQRTRLQQVLDTCTLNAASLKQTLDAEQVVRDCATREGLGGAITGVQVTTSAGAKTVTATGHLDVTPYFMDAMNVDVLEANGKSVAQQKAANIEIVLVLDLSGSMNDNSRLTNMKTSAKNFVSTVLTNSENRISISVVPYNGAVNLGSALRAKFNVTDVNGLSNVDCVDLPTSVYSASSITTSTAMPMSVYSDMFTDTGDSNGSLTNSYFTTNMGLGSNIWCPSSTTNLVRLPDNNISNLQTYINNLTATGATSIDAGMKWGAFLLDPNARATVNSFVGSTVPSAFVNRPFDYTKKDALKIIVLMTDGENFPYHQMNAGYRTGNSVIYKYTSLGTNYYSIYHANSTKTYTTGGKTYAAKYWVPHRSEWRPAPWEGSTSTITSSRAPMTWVQVWSELRVKWVAWQLYARALGTSNTTRTTEYNTAMNNFRSVIGTLLYSNGGWNNTTTTMDNQLQTTCTTAKNQGVIVYGIAFEAPTDGQTQIKNCASSAGYYFNASDSTKLQAAFTAIATNITQLRLSM